MDTITLKQYLISDISTWTAYTLQSKIDGISGPDSHKSVGAVFLDNVRDCVVEAIASILVNENVDDAEVHYNDRIGWDKDPLLEAVEEWHNGSEPSEIADGAPSVYTHLAWEQFLDLAAYNVDVSDFGDITGDDLSRVAGVALYVVANNLINAIVDEITERLHGLEYDPELNPNDEDYAPTGEAI